MLDPKDFTWNETRQCVLEDESEVMDYFYDVAGDSAKELTKRYMEQSMVSVIGVVYSTESGGIVGVKRLFPFNVSTDIVEDDELLSILLSKPEIPYVK